MRSTKTPIEIFYKKLVQGKSVSKALKHYQENAKDIRHSVAQTDLSSPIRITSLDKKVLAKEPATIELLSLAILLCEDHTDNTVQLKTIHLFEILSELDIESLQTLQNLLIEDLQDSSFIKCGSSILTSTSQAIQKRRAQIIVSSLPKFFQEITEIKNTDNQKTPLDFFIKALKNTKNPLQKANNILSKNLEAIMQRLITLPAYMNFDPTKPLTTMDLIPHDTIEGICANIFLKYEPETNQRSIQVLLFTLINEFKNHHLDLFEILDRLSNNLDSFIPQYQYEARFETCKLSFRNLIASLKIEFSYPKVNASTESSTTETSTDLDSLSIHERICINELHQLLLQSMRNPYSSAIDHIQDFWSKHANQSNTAISKLNTFPPCAGLTKVELILCLACNIHFHRAQVITILFTLMNTTLNYLSNEELETLIKYFHRYAFDEELKQYYVQLTQVKFSHDYHIRDIRTTLLNAIDARKALGKPTTGVNNPSTSANDVPLTFKGLFPDQIKQMLNRKDSALQSKESVKVISLAAFYALCRKEVYLRPEAIAYFKRYKTKLCSSPYGVSLLSSDPILNVDHNQLHSIEQLALYILFQTQDRNGENLKNCLRHILRGLHHDERDQLKNKVLIHLKDPAFSKPYCLMLGFHMKRNDRQMENMVNKWLSLCEDPALKTKLYLAAVRKRKRNSRSKTKEQQPHKQMNATSETLFYSPQAATISIAPMGSTAQIYQSLSPTIELPPVRITEAELQTLAQLDTTPEPHTPLPFFVLPTPEQIDPLPRTSSEEDILLSLLNTLG